MQVSSGSLATNEEHGGCANVVVGSEPRGSQDIFMLTQGSHKSPAEHDCNFSKHSTAATSTEEQQQILARTTQQIILCGEQFCIRD